MAMMVPVTTEPSIRSLSSKGLVEQGAKSSVEGVAWVVIWGWVMYWVLVLSPSSPPRAVALASVPKARVEEVKRSINRLPACRRALVRRRKRAPPRRRFRCLGRWCRSQTHLAGAKGAIARERSRASRSCSCARTSSYIVGTPRACNSLHRRLARSSTLAVTKILWLASGRTIVPMSRPASTAPGLPSPKARWKARSARRTSGIAATTDAPWLTASLRSAPRSRSAAVTAAAAAAALAVSVNGLPACRSAATAR